MKYLNKFGKWAWKWRWPLGAWVWLTGVTVVTVDTYDWWAGGYVVGGFIMGSCWVREVAKVKAASDAS